MQGKATIGGTPIHATLVPLPVGFFVGALICDAISRWGDPTFWPRMAVTLVGFGLIAGLIAAIAEFADYNTTPMTEEAKRTATSRLTMNLLVIAIFAVEYFVRIIDITAVPGYLLEILGILALYVSGYLGGQLVYRYRVGVAQEPEREVRTERGTIASRMRTLVP